jgi:hypothetical protein
MTIMPSDEILCQFQGSGVTDENLQTAWSRNVKEFTLNIK